ncbi:uncharacterized protein LOC123350075 isoform X1 [Mauremys mutica]|uniref:uncharacterized protein LOC123350075 isoform X1 n=1 Tax=Mauremys mutica TaxID=74926 RepID=UPI001D16A318|nr:uncharacterized protein LOC123350075 isoform X1 [Mauremys mutica]
MTTLELFFAGTETGTTIIPLLSSVLQDTSQFKSPNDFDPRHFLDGNSTSRRTVPSCRSLQDEDVEFDFCSVSETKGRRGEISTGPCRFRCPHKPMKRHEHPNSQQEAA